MTGELTDEDALFVPDGDGIITVPVVVVDNVLHAPAVFGQKL